MMSFKSSSAVLAAAALVVAPIAVQAAPVERASAETGEQNELGGPALYALIALVVIALYFVIDGGKANSVSA
jgi:hypothetical protein